jgi:hypothetical protein
VDVTIGNQMATTTTDHEEYGSMQQTRSRSRICEKNFRLFASILRPDCGAHHVMKGQSGDSPKDIPKLSLSQKKLHLVGLEKEKDPKNAPPSKTDMLRKISPRQQ